MEEGVQEYPHLLSLRVMRLYNSVSKNTTGPIVANMSGKELFIFQFQFQFKRRLKRRRKRQIGFRTSNESYSITGQFWIDLYVSDIFGLHRSVEYFEGSC